MARKFVRNITGTKLRGKKNEIEPLYTNLQNDLLSDDEDVFIRNIDEYHCITDNIKEVNVDSGNIQVVNNKNDTVIKHTPTVVRVNNDPESKKYLEVNKKDSHIYDIKFLPDSLKDFINNEVKKSNEMILNHIHLDEIDPRISYNTESKDFNLIFLGAWGLDLDNYKGEYLINIMFNSEIISLGGQEIFLTDRTSHFLQPRESLNDMLEDLGSPRFIPINIKLTRIDKFVTEFPVPDPEQDWAHMVKVIPAQLEIFYEDIELQ